MESTNRRLQRAKEHVSRYWFPFNEQLVSKIKKGLGTGVYDLSLDFLIADLKTDASLFSYCLKEISNMLSEERVPVQASDNPLEIFKLAGIFRIKKLFASPYLNSAEKDGHPHSIERASALQAARLRETVISTSVMELLADRERINPHLGYCAALLRQLGLALISWNYPSIYEKAMKSIGPDADLDTALSSLLGFSPKALAIAVFDGCERMPMLEDMLLSEDEFAADESPRERHPVAEQLEDLCEIGEALARANHPEYYPTAAIDWNDARDRLERHLGVDGLQLVQQKIRENCQYYSGSYPEIFKSLDSINPTKKLYAQEEKVVQELNSYVKHCDPLLRKKIKELYAQMSNRGSQVHSDNLRFLFREVMPAAGFHGCCVFTIEPSTMNLLPRLQFGMLQLIDPGPVDYYHGPANAIDNLILKAFNSQAPVLDSDLQSREDVTFMAQVIQGNNRVGVLYVEYSVPEESMKDEAVPPLVGFKAVLQCLKDCLGLG